MKRPDNFPDLPLRTRVPSDWATTRSPRIRNGSNDSDEPGGVQGRGAALALDPCRVGGRPWPWIPLSRTAALSGSAGSATVLWPNVGDSFKTPTSFYLLCDQDFTFTFYGSYSEIAFGLSLLSSVKSVLQSALLSSELPVKEIYEPLLRSGVWKQRIDGVIISTTC